MNLKIKIEFLNNIFEKIISNIVKYYNSNILLTTYKYDIILTDNKINNINEKYLYITSNDTNIENKNILSLFNHLNILNISENDLNKNDTLLFYFSNLIYNFILEHYPKLDNTCIVLDPIRSLEYIINTKKSLSRFGDGELIIAEGNDMVYEKAITFQKDSIEILKNTNDNCFIGICDVFYEPSFKYWKEHESKFWNSKVWIKRYFNFCPKQKIYLSAQVSRPQHYSYNCDDNITLFNHLDYLTLKQQIYLNKKILCIQNITYLNNYYQNILYAASTIDYFIIQSTNASCDMDEIISYVITNKNKYELILLFAGPMASYLSNLFSTHDIQAIDLGSCQYNTNSDNKEKILKNIKIINNILNIYNIKLIQPKIFDEHSSIKNINDTKIINKNIIWSIDNSIKKIFEQENDLYPIRINFISSSNLTKLDIMKCIFKLESSEAKFRLYNGIKWLNLENNKEYEIEFNFQKNWGISFTNENFKEFLNGNRELKMEIYNVLIKIIT
jgi:hypothetical protein